MRHNYLPFFSNTSKIVDDIYIYIYKYNTSHLKISSIICNYNYLNVNYVKYICCGKSKELRQEFISVDFI